MSVQVPRSFYFDLSTMEADLNALYPRRLDSKNLQVRLIKVHPGTRRDQIHCSLGTFSLESGLTYKALSYVWGDPQVTEDVIINDHVFLATTNLAAALKQFRRHHYQGFVWVDAICINQSDLVERSDQVPLMFSIYSQAAEVVAWLGLETSNSRKAVVYLDKFDHRSDMQRRRYAHQKTLDAILNLLSRPWWFRVWIAQEMILPRMLAVWCGPDNVNFGNLDRMLIWGY